MKTIWHYLHSPAGSLHAVKGASGNHVGHNLGQHDHRKEYDQRVRNLEF